MKLNKKIIINKIGKNKKQLRARGVKKIGIFGSFAKDKYSKTSDIDVLVKFENVNFDNYIGLLFFLERIFKKKIDLVIEDDLKPELKYVKKEAEYVKI
ncbi:nucleotidyltransferase domain-containing protein [Patescibacteria group bacterium]|nr:nucleotidyltransferase domain-containing protein [Patescibacteria group bacterium]